MSQNDPKDISLDAMVDMFRNIGFHVITEDEIMNAVKYLKEQGRVIETVVDNEPAIKLVSSKFESNKETDR